MRCRLIVLVLLCAAAPLRAHETAAVLGVLSTATWDDVCATDSATATLSAVRTSIGVVTAAADGTWAYGCPSLIGANITSVFAAETSGQLVAAIATGELHLSTDAGCTWSRLALPSTDHFAYEIVGAAGAIWVLARSAAQAELLRVEADASMQVVAQWARDGEAAFTPDAVFVVDGEVPQLLVAGARPTPRLEVFDVAGREATRSASVAVGAPAVALQRLAPRGLLDSSTALLVATDENGRRVASLDVQGSDALLVDLLGPVEVLHGPVAAGDGFLVLADGVLHTVGDATQRHAAVPWKCVQRVGDRLFACNLYDMLEIVDLDAALTDGSGTVPVFSTAQIGPPRNDCGRGEPEQNLCTDDWLHYGSENFFLDRVPVLCPDGSGEYPGSDTGVGDAGLPGDVGGAGETRSPDGCAAAPIGLGWLTGLFALFARRRRVW